MVIYNNYIYMVYTVYFAINLLRNMWFVVKYAKYAVCYRLIIKCAQFASKRRKFAAKCVVYTNR